MFVGEFEVLLAKAQEYDAYQGFLQSVRDYWLARVDLMRVVGSRLPSERQPSENTPSVEQILTPPPPAPMHMGHGGHGGTPHDQSAMRGMAMPAPAPAPTSTPTSPPKHHHSGDPS
jgi:cobalt-zinc-cadmium efflux system outer membrane protein